MLMSADAISGMTPDARDGPIGTVKDLYFDDEYWTVRYVVVDTGGWLSGRRVLVSPYAIEGLDAAGSRMRVLLTREQIEKSPGVDSDKPVSRQHEVDYHSYYGYPVYWGGPLLWGAAGYPALDTVPLVQPEETVPAHERERVERERKQADVHLRSSNEVRGYDVEASDGGVGHVDDFLFDDRSWEIRYVVVDTRNWWPGKHVLIAPEWIDGIDWSNRRIHVKVTTAQVRESPPYEPATPMTPDYERTLRAHYYA